MAYGELLEIGVPVHVVHLHVNYSIAQCRYGSVDLRIRPTVDRCLRRAEVDLGGAIRETEAAAVNIHGRARSPRYRVQVVDEWCGGGIHCERLCVRGPD